jgi:hypothetical protein
MRRGKYNVLDRVSEVRTSDLRLPNTSSPVGPEMVFLLLYFFGLASKERGNNTDCRNYRLGANLNQVGAPARGTG